jgi:hypothetical protein
MLNFQALPHSVTSLLTMQKLTSESSIEILDKFFKSVVTSSDMPFKLGSRVLQILFETFAFCDLSVKNVLTAYQVRNGFARVIVRITILGIFRRKPM